MRTPSQARLSPSRGGDPQVKGFDYNASPSTPFVRQISGLGDIEDGEDDIGQHSSDESYGAVEEYTGGSPYSNNASSTTSAGTFTPQNASDGSGGGSKGAFKLPHVGRTATRTNL